MSPGRSEEPTVRPRSGRGHEDGGRGEGLDRRESGPTGAHGDAMGDGGLTDDGDGTDPD